jgi:Ran GTPase-activating protein (RanGAP) involved in mRNA processing and transport
MTRRQTTVNLMVLKKSSHQIKTDIVTNNVTKLLEKEGLYKFERKERGGNRKTVDYANNVVKHTAKFRTQLRGPARSCGTDSSYDLPSYSGSNHGS